MTARGKGPRPYPRPPKLTEAEALRFVVRWSRVIRAMLIRNDRVPLQDVDDLVQEVLVTTWIAAKERRVDLRAKPAVRAWLRIVAHRKAVDAASSTASSIQICLFRSSFASPVRSFAYRSAFAFVLCVPL